VLSHKNAHVLASVTTGALGSRDLTIDFGLVPLIEIGDFVWRDNNNDGLQTAGEPGINGITLILRRQSDNVEVDRTTTIADPKAPFADGYYLFTNRRSTQIRPVKIQLEKDCYSTIFFFFFLTTHTHSQRNTTLCLTRIRQVCS
jgi:hypothetical protein